MSTSGLPVVVDLMERLGEERVNAEGTFPVNQRELVQAAKRHDAGVETLPLNLEVILPVLDFIKESLDVSPPSESELRPLPIGQLVRAGSELDTCIEDILQMLLPCPF